MLPYAPYVVWLLPLSASFTFFLLERVSHKLRDYFAVAVGFISAIFAASMIPSALSGYVEVGGIKYPLPYDWVLIDWVPIGKVRVTLGVLIDPLSIFMANVVAWISAFILLYSVEYMHGDRGISRYWMLMTLFIGAMQLLVLADNLLLMLFGWEGVGFCSYALIGYWYTDEKKYWVGPYSPSHCGMKAFITTRIGDVGFLVGTIVLLSYSGTLNFLELSQQGTWAYELARDGLLALTLLLLFLGPIGKSAQFPLHEWLPEAMAGPTTVSALIHAATMVKAGVYFIARILLVLYPIHGLSEMVWSSLESFFVVVAWIGAFTAFLAASMGMVSDQLKKVLAYSTISQLGYMFAILGVAGLLMHHSEAFVEGYLSGMYHLLSHAIFKALLFLSAGAVGHAVETYMLHEMGGLKKYMPKTYALMLIGALSLAGVPPFNGFWSKDSILHVMYVEGYYGLFLVLAITAIITVFYSFRIVGLVFHGEESEHIKGLLHEGHEPHDPGKHMLIPLYALAALSIVSGLLLPSVSALFFPSFEHIGIDIAHLAKLPVYDYLGYYHTTLTSVTFLCSILIILIGFYPSASSYITRKWNYRSIVDGNAILRGLWRFLYDRWYINPVYYAIFVNGIYKASKVAFDALELTGAGTLIKDSYASFSNVVRRIQTGYLRGNMVYVILCLVFLLIIAILMGW